MTDIYTVSLDAVNGATFRGRVHIVNTDVISVSHEAHLPLALVIDAWNLMAKGYLRGGYGDERLPIPLEQAQETATSMRLSAELEELHDLYLGKIRVNEQGELVAKDGRTVLEPRRLAKDVYDVVGTGADKISRFHTTDDTFVEFRRRASAVVRSYSVGPVRNLPQWSEVAAWDDEDDPWEPGEREDYADEVGEADLGDYRVWVLLRSRGLDQRPYVDITATMRDEGYLVHLVPGLRWSTAVA